MKYNESDSNLHWSRFDVAVEIFIFIRYSLGYETLSSITDSHPRDTIVVNELIDAYISDEYGCNTEYDVDIILEKIITYLDEHTNLAIGKYYAK